MTLLLKNCSKNQNAFIKILNLGVILLRKECVYRPANCAIIVRFHIQDQRIHDIPMFEPYGACSVALRRQSWKHRQSLSSLLLLRYCQWRSPHRYVQHQHWKILVIVHNNCQNASANTLKHRDSFGKDFYFFIKLVLYFDKTLSKVFLNNFHALNQSYINDLIIITPCKV